MVLLEAMASGVPTVSSNVDGIPEVVAEGETGLTADPDNYEVLSQHLIQLCQDHDLAVQMGAAGRQRAIDCFHKDRIVPQYVACYETCCSGACR